MIRSLLSAKVGQLFQHLDLIGGHILESAALVHLPEIIGIGAGEHTIKFTSALIVRPARAGENPPLWSCGFSRDLYIRRVRCCAPRQSTDDHSGGIFSA